MEHLRRLRLREATIALMMVDGKQCAVHVPALDEITVFDDLLGDRRPNQLVHVEWHGENVEMFATDLRDRGEWIDSVVHST